MNTKSNTWTNKRSSLDLKTTFGQGLHSLLDLAYCNTEGMTKHKRINNWKYCHCQNSKITWFKVNETSFTTPFHTGEFFFNISTAVLKLTTLKHCNFFFVGKNPYGCRYKQLQSNGISQTSRFHRLKESTPFFARYDTKKN